MRKNLLATLLAAASMAACTSGGAPPTSAPAETPAETPSSATSSAQPLTVPVLPRLQATTAEILASAESWTIYALNPGSRWSDKDFEHDLHGYEILGEATLDSIEDRQTLSRALAQGIRDSDGSVAGCFDPRHGISATTEAGTVDLVICFQCIRVHVYSSLSDADQSTGTTSAPRAAFDQVFEAAGLVVAD